MRALFVYVTGRLSDTPSHTRGFTALAYDMVEWWDEHVKKGARISDFLTLRRHVISALSGRDDGDLRPIRPSHRRGTGDALDDLRVILESSGTGSDRITRIARRLDVYASHGLIATPIIDAPCAVHICRCDRTTITDSRVVKLRASRSRAPEELARVLREFCTQPAEVVDVLVFFDRIQLRYVSALVGESTLESLSVKTPRLCLRHFVNKEKLGPGMPMALMGKRVLACESEEMDANFASIMSSIAHKLGVLELLPGICGACKVTVQEAIDRGVRFRCARLVSLHASCSTVDVFDEDIANATESADASVVGGHVIAPTRTLVTNALAVVDFASLYPSIIAATGAGAQFGLPGLVRELMERRRSTSDAGLARACKLVANSLYGQLASPTSPMYDPDEANAITAEGRRRLMSLVEHLQEHGGHVIYGDTDSCMVTFDEHPRADACAAKAQECVAEFNGLLPDPMCVVVQDIFNKSVFLSKKKYVGIASDGSMHYTGTINIRADSPQVVRMEYEGLAKHLLQDAGSATDITARVLRTRDTIKTAPASRMRAVRKLTSMDKNTTSPATATPHVELARRENFRENGLGYSAEDSIEFAPYISRPSASANMARAGQWVCENEDAAATRCIEWRPTWKTYLVAATSLVEAVLGDEVAKDVNGECRDKTRYERCLFGKDDGFA
jgi:DNA polymerase family B